MTTVSTSPETSRRPVPGAAPAPIRVALAGGGKMAQNHARAIGRTPTPAQLVAVADPSPEARAGIQAIAPGAAGYADLAELLEKERPDVLHICTPPTTHAALATAALEAGCHVYVEKPFVESGTEAEELLELANSRGLKVCAGHQLLYEPPTRRALELLPAIGRLSHVESYFSFRTVRRAPGGRVPLRSDLQLLDILPHPVYLLLRFLEEGTEGRTELTALEVGEGGTIHALVRRGNLTGNLVVTLEGRPVESYMRLVGANGSIFADYVRSTVQRQIGPGISGIDKLFAPYRTARQLVGGTTAAMARRFLKKQTSYPGLAELFDAFYGSIGTRGRVAHFAREHPRNDADLGRDRPGHRGYHRGAGSGRTRAGGAERHAGGRDRRHRVPGQGAGGAADRPGPPGDGAGPPRSGRLGAGAGRRVPAGGPRRPAAGGSAGGE